MSVVSSAPLPLHKKQIECTCAPCKQFWKSTLHQEGGDLIRLTSNARAEKTAVLGQKGPYRIGERVVVNGKHEGVIEFVGIADDHKIAPETHVGVHLYDNVYSTHNGVYKGKRFFHCPRGHGAMVKYSEVRPLHPIPSSRSVTGNSMFPSHDQVQRRRKERQKKIFEEEEALRNEYEAKRKAQLEYFSKRCPPPRISPRSTRASKLREGQEEDHPQLPIQDDDDIALRDYREKRRKKQEQEYQASLVDHEELKMQRMKKMLGGDARADRLAETLKKLHVAYEEGKVIAMADREYSQSNNSQFL